MSLVVVSPRRGVAVEECVLVTIWNGALWRREEVCLTLEHGSVVVRVETQCERVGHGVGETLVSGHVR